MFLFGSKKKFKPLPLPEFPEIPKESELPKFPSYEQVTKKLEIPQMPPIRSNFDIPKREHMAKKIPHKEFMQPAREITPIVKSVAHEKSLYIRMEDYEKIISMLELIRNKINNAESTLLNLEKFKEKEDMKIKLWKDEINRIKENLILIEERLAGSQQ